MSESAENFECQRCGECCGPVPIFKEFYLEHRHKALRVHELKEFGNKVIAITEDCRCIWLDDFKQFNIRCAIYEDRPEVCRQFGRNPKNEMLLKCPHLMTEAEKMELEMKCRLLNEAMRRK